MTKTQMIKMIPKRLAEGLVVAEVVYIDFDRIDNPSTLIKIDEMLTPHNTGMSFRETADAYRAAGNPSHAEVYDKLDACSQRLSN